ncbi:MAG: RNA polymerase subunit sigma [Isosphaera sp.]|nr:RNA polymerase subunit sigma [Isosphaera sp.]
MDADAREVARFGQHLTAIQRQLFVYVTQLLGRTADADDVLQDVNRVLWEKYAEFTPGTNLTAWAYKVAYFEVLRYRKTKVRDRLRFGEDTLAVLAAEAAPVADAESARRVALRECLDKLPADDRDLVTKRYLGGVEVRDLARFFRRSEKAVYRALARVRGALLECVRGALAAEGLR